MFLKFEECCCHLLKEFTPAFDTLRHLLVRAVRDCIARLRRAVKSDQSENATLAHRLAKVTHRHRVLTEKNLNLRDAKSFFQYSNSRLKCTDDLPTLKSGGLVATSEADKADLLGKHFAF